MRRREVAAAEAVVVLLPAVVRQRLAPQLAARDAAAISERGHEQRIYRRHLLEPVEHSVRALVHERHGPHLDADHRPIGGLRAAPPPPRRPPRRPPPPPRPATPRPQGGPLPGARAPPRAGA